MAGCYQQHSYISQVRYYTQIIRENDAWEYVDIYADEGLTGLSAAKRPDFQRLMVDCRAGKIDRILCKSVSRFSRNFTDCVQSIRELQMLGVSVLFEKENLDTAKKGDELMLALQSLWAQRESVSIAGNMRHGVRMRMRNGKAESGCTAKRAYWSENQNVTEKMRAYRDLCFAMSALWYILFIIHRHYMRHHNWE